MLEMGGGADSNREDDDGGDVVAGIGSGGSGVALREDGEDDSCVVNRERASGRRRW